MEYFSKILHIDLNEDADSVIGRLSSLDDQDIILAIPAGAQIFKSPSELKTLKKTIDGSGKNIVLVSQDDEGIELARDLGFRVEEEFLELLSPDNESPSDHKYSASTHKHPKVFDIVSPGTEHKTVPTPRKMEIEQVEPEKEMGEIAIPVRHFAEEATREEIPEQIIQPKIEPREESKLAPILEKKKSFKFSGFNVGFKKPSFSVISAIVVFIIVSFAATAMALGTILPRATIEIFPKTESIAIDLPIKADVSLSDTVLDQNKIPGQIIKIEKTQSMEFEATGKQNAESKAKGKVTIYNYFTPPQSQALVKTTRFETADGKIFRITDSVSVPASKIENGKTVPGLVETEVVADATGPEYNIGPSEFTIPGFKGSPKYNLFSAKSISNMTGGSKGEGVVATAEDIEKAKTALKESLSEAAKNELREKLVQGLASVDEAITVKIIEENVSAAPNTPADKFTVSAKASAMSFQFNEDDVNRLIAKNIETKTSKDKIVFKDLTKKYGNINIDFAGGVITFTAHAEQNIQADFDIESLKKMFAGKNEDGVREYIINNDMVESAQVSFWPFWVKKAPNSANRIKIIIGK